MVFAWRWSRSRHLAGYQGCRRGAGDHGGPSAGQGKYYGPRVHRSRSTLATPLAHGQPRAQAIRAGANQPSNWGVLDQFHTRGLAATAELAKLPRPQMRDNQGSNTMRDATFSRRDMLWAGGALTVGAAFAGPLKAAAAELSGVGPEPTSWVDSAMPEVTHRMIETNGIRLHVAEQGEGPLIILCHGFPECWYSWRHQLRALAKAGFRAVAPDLRGYGRSDRPEDVEKYTILDDIGDIVGLVDALGAKQAVIAGHDIGAAVAWQTALLRPDRFRAVIALSPPFRSRGVGDSGPPTTLMPRNENAVVYQLFFQNPAAEARLGRDLPF